MSTINNSLLSNSGYYQLNSQGGGTASGNTSTSSPTDALLQALNSNSSQTSANSNNAFLLDLSPQAQQYLNNGGSASSTGSLLGGSGSFVLSTQQRQTITDILAKYKDAPYTQDTFNQIQNDLEKAGLGPDVLSLKDKANSFNPVTTLITALNGGSPNGTVDTGTTSGADEQAKATSYIQGIISQWKTISTTDTAPASNGTSSNEIAPVASGGAA